jgi:hypothetical protein
MTQLVPYPFHGVVEYPRTQQPAVPGQVQGVSITLHPDHREPILEKITGWFAGRGEIDLIDTGVSDKVGLGYILLEWIEHEIDPLFLAILRDEEVVADYRTCIRDIKEV